MGTVVKLTLQFRSRFWPVEDFGFIHADDRPLGTWWSDRRGPVLTGWAGGPRSLLDALAAAPLAAHSMWEPSDPAPVVRYLIPEAGRRLRGRARSGHEGA